MLKLGSLTLRGFPDGSVAKNLPAKRRRGFDSWVGKIPWRRAWQPTGVFWPGKPQGQSSLSGYSPWGCKRAGHDLVTQQQQPPNSLLFSQP